MNKHHNSLVIWFILLNLLLCAGCTYLSQKSPSPTWQSRSEAITGLIKHDIKLHVYDSANVYQRSGFYYGVRHDHGNFLYSPDEAAERLLDSTIYISTPTHTYVWEFRAGIPNGLWAYAVDTTVYLVETYDNGQLLKRKKLRFGQALYEIETYRDGQLIKREEVPMPPKN